MILNYLSVSLQTDELGALDGAVREHRAELLLSHLKNVVKCERQQFGFRLELGRGVAHSLEVVGTALLTLVAAVHMISYNLAHPLGQLALVLDGKARNATAGIDSVATSQSSARACLLAGTSSSVVSSTPRKK